MNAIAATVERRPVLVIAIIDAILILLVSFGIHIDPAQIAAIDGLLAAIGVLLAQSQVTPVAAPVLANGTVVTTPTGGDSVVKAL